MAGERGFYLATLAAALAVAVAGCGGGGPSKAEHELAAGLRPARATCSGGVRTNDTCTFAANVAAAHRREGQALMIAGEGFTCIGNQVHWVCRSVRREAWAEHP